MQARQKFSFLLLTTLFIMAGITDTASAERGEPDVHYVPTPQYVVNEMLEMAGTNKDDVVYDLGCGDGRFVITAAKKYGAHGIGIDIDPQRVRESQANARSAGVSEQVRFVEADLFKSDISRATVVSLYLLPALNLQLRPKLFKELKPGTRIVSHDWDMADWQPDNEGQLGRSSYFLWILPADVAGQWNVTLSASAGPDQRYKIGIIQKFQQIDGQAFFSGSEIASSDFKLKGDKLSFFLSRSVQGIKVDMHFKGQVKGDSLSGDVQIEGGPFAGSHSWTAMRSK